MTYPNTHPNDLMFPSTEAGSDGLTKREWFAGMAMQGMLASPVWTNEVFSSVAGYAVQEGDAIIAALNQEQDDE